MLLALLATLLAPAPPADTVRAVVIAIISEESSSHPFLIGEISGIATDAAGRVYVTDFQEPRVLVFAPTGAHLATIGAARAIPSRFDGTSEGPPLAPWRSRLASAIDREGRFDFPLEAGYPEGLTHYAYARYALDGCYVDSLLLRLYATSRAGWASVPVTPGSGRVVRGVNTVRTVIIPAACQSEPRLAASGKTIACMVVDPETGAQGIAISRLP